ncbi:hypothetical protein CH063_00569 [Colletotrichum higginsianum]|uniref:Uncharacterized protein n=1 Tax=Colletotrichum higginsianum (strain IMI 349063) TaxID=759273 RepID=H1VZR3_COLHI|nr:hypothetical protein CH063_00569 [Colletotrichum higginsianum]
MDKRPPPMRHLRLPTPALVQLRAGREACDHRSRHPDIWYCSGFHCGPVNV